MVLAACGAAPGPHASGPVAAGQRIYDSGAGPNGDPDGGPGMVSTDALIRRAVTRGIGADGDSLFSAMPRWQLTDAEWRDLLAYMKALP